MAPRARPTTKRQRGESSQRAQGPAQGAAFRVFNTNQAEERYRIWISTREFKKERGIQLLVPAEWNWGHRLLAQPGDAFCSLVREFYANAGDGVQTDSSIVRGVRVSFSSEAINAYYGTTDFEGDDYFHSELRLNRLTQEQLTEIATSFHPEAIWNIRNGLPAHMDYEYFSPQDRGTLDFIKAKLIPHSHRGNVRRDQVLLTYCIKEQQTIDVGVIINGNIREVALSNEKSRCQLCHPFLITELCRLAGVPINENQEDRLKPQSFITPRYIDIRYGQGRRPILDDEDEQDVEPQGDDEAMGGAENIPQPAAPESTQAPPQYDMAQFFARQEEFMRRQEEYMRMGNEVNWFVSTSMYQHNQAAQGFSPNFPPPPSWLQDPQFIPEYYRSHFPPPPPDSDHH